MRILIDSRFGGEPVGIGRVTRSIVPRLLEMSSHTFGIIVRSADEPWLSSLPVHAERIVCDIPHYSITEQWVIPRITRRFDADLFLTLHFNLPLFLGTPAIAFIHDLILHRHPGESSWLRQLVYRGVMRRTIHHARSLLVPTQFVKEDLVHTYGHPFADKISVVGEGIDAEFVPQELVQIDELKQRFALPEGFFLCVGSHKPHKKLDVLIQAFSSPTLHDRHLVLVLPPFDPLRNRRLPANIHLLPTLSDHDLPPLYSAALCTLSASIDEGFCLPLAEALACGCPVIAVNRSCIPEVMQGHATLIEPTVQAFIEACSNTPSHSTPIRLGTWEEVARKVLAVIERG